MYLFKKENGSVFKVRKTQSDVPTGGYVLVGECDAKGNLVGKKGKQEDEYKP